MDTEQIAIRKKITTFLIVSFIAGWAFQFLGLHLESNENEELGEMIIILSTFMPLLGVILAQHFHMETKSCGIRWALPGKKDIKYVVLAWVLPLVLTILGAILYFVIFPGNFDPQFHYLHTGTGAIKTSAFLSAFITGPIISAIEGIGGEIGWHSYFIPLLEKKKGVFKAMVICGLVWGIWYAPLIIHGHDFGTDYFGAPITGILTLCVYYILLSMFFTWLHMKTETIYVPGLAHGTFAAIEPFALQFTLNYPKGHILGPSLPGVISMIPLLIFIIYLIKRDAFKEGEEE